VRSLAPAGVCEAHLRRDPQGRPEVWLTTQTVAQRRRLEVAPWLDPQVEMILTVTTLRSWAAERPRILVDSQEDQAQLMMTAGENLAHAA
jgi:hypothetical protein